MIFYDTSSLLKLNDNLFDEKFMISSITIKELENIKNSTNKDADIKYAARKIGKQLKENLDKWELILFQPSMLEIITQYDLEITDDTKILACAIHERNRIDEFYTEDINLYHMALLFFDKARVTSLGDDAEIIDYTGYTEVTLDDMEMANFYSFPNNNIYDLYNNEYLLIRDKNNKVVDLVKWSNNHYVHLLQVKDGELRPAVKSFKSKLFGEVRAMKEDYYQLMAADSLAANQITMLKGKAGTGKTLLSLSFLFDRLEAGYIDKIVVFCNTVATKDSAKLGFYPGDRETKLLDSQIGNLLMSKLGDRILVERMIDDGTLVLLPMSDIRGYETPPHSGVYLSEAQNMSINLMKLALQRIDETSICIIDGDDKTQVDDISFSGSNNGMRRASKIFRGEDIYGEVTLQNIHRSKIAQIAESM